MIYQFMWWCFIRFLFWPTWILFYCVVSLSLRWNWMHNVWRIFSMRCANYGSWYGCHFHEAKDFLGCLEEVSLVMISSGLILLLVDWEPSRLMIWMLPISLVKNINLIFYLNKIVTSVTNNIKIVVNSRL